MLKKKISRALACLALVFGLWTLYFSNFLPGWDLKWRASASLIIALLVYQLGIRGVGMLNLLSQKFDAALDSISIETIVGGGGGLVFGILAGAVSAYPLSSIGGAQGAAMVLLIFFISAFLGIKIGSRRALDIFGCLPLNMKKTMDEKALHYGGCKILDTSAIIDGRIYDVCLSNFLEGTLLVPTFVIEELQHIADSSDHIRRSKGRRGLDLLSKMQKHSNIKVDIIESNPYEERDVDAKLVRLCKQLGAGIITNDYNLNKVAELQGLKVLNINELTNAVKVMVFPGENMHITIIKEGKEPGQGVGYLEDGTMVVVEDAYAEIGRDLEVTVTSVFQTAAGRMIFTRKIKVADIPGTTGTALQNIQEVNIYG